MLPASASSLSKVRFGETATDKTRVVFDIDGPVEYSLSGDQAGEGRLIVDIAELTTDASGTTPRQGGGLVASYRYAQQAGGSSRFVFDFDRTAKIAKAFVLSPSGSAKQHRLVIDLTAADKAAFMASLPKRYKDITEVIAATAPEADQRSETGQRVATNKQQVVPVRSANNQTVDAVPSKRAAKKARKKERQEDWPIIVIDPGHGGGDPGAQGQKGTLEKTVTLSSALLLSDMLKAKGRYRIVLTRADDSRLGLQHRARIARSARPQLFISLHADAIDNKDLRGGSVYTLNAEGKERTVQEAQTQKDYQVGDLKMSDVTPELGGILLDVAQTETLNNSSRFASILVKRLKSVTPLLKNAQREKDLRVLLAPDVPAVLLELAFISNKKDEENLNSAKWREKTMAAVAASIDEYFDSKEEQRRAAKAESRQAG